jgi:uncharacterized phage protein gp47/JayE
MVTTLVNNTPAITNLRPGSIAYALLQAVTGNAIALQQSITHVYNVTRLATSSGSDVDSFVADYGLLRLPAVTAVGTVTFARVLTGVQVVIPVGAVVQTLSGIQFGVIADTTNPNYNATLNGYVMAADSASVNATVAALVAGSASNVLANTVIQLVSGVTGVNSVNNALDITNGDDAESDSALKARFQQYIASLGKATHDSIAASISSIQAGLTFALADQLHNDGSSWPGGFDVVVDDGSGAIGATLLSEVSLAVSSVKALGVAYSVFAPTNVAITVSVAIHVSTGYSPSVVIAAVQAALTSYINTLGVGVNVGYANVGSVVQNVAGVAAYTSLTVNGGTSDVAISYTHLARMNGTPTVTTY